MDIWEWVDFQSLALLFHRVQRKDKLCVRANFTSNMNLTMAQRQDWHEERKRPENTDAVSPIRTVTCG